MTSRKVPKLSAMGNCCRQLPTEVRNHIRTGFVVNSISQCVEELVYNAIDAEATDIKLEVDFTRFNVSIEDNGQGISKEDFEILGRRYATSKCHSLEDLNNLKYYGYRGEALSSIIDCSSLVEITTRPVGGHVYRRIFRKTVNGQIEKMSSNEKVNSGVKISISDLLGNYPVRQNKAKKTFEIVDIKDKLEKIALVNPKLTIVFKDSESKKGNFLQILPSDSLLSSFKQFLKFKHNHLIEVFQQYNIYLFNGVISNENHNTKDYQLVYVNRKPIPRHKLHRSIHQCLINGVDSGATMKSIGDTNSSGKSEKYPVFVINIECPYDEYDIMLDPHKSIVEFKHLDMLLLGVEAMVGKYYSLIEKTNRVILKRSKSFGGLKKINSLSALTSINKPFNKADINLHDFKGSIRSRLAVKTKAPETVVRDEDDDEEEKDVSIAKRSKSSTKSGANVAKSIASSSWRGKIHNSSSSSPSTASNHSQDRSHHQSKVASKPNPLLFAKRRVFKYKDVKNDRTNRSNIIKGSSIPISLQSNDLLNKIQNNYPDFRVLKENPLRGKKRVRSNDEEDDRDGDVSKSPLGQLVPLASKKRPRNDKICESISKLSVSRVSSESSNEQSHKKRRIDVIKYNDIEIEEDIASKSSEENKQDRAMMPSNKQQNSQSFMIPTTFNIKDKSKTSLDTTSSTDTDKDRTSAHFAYYTKIAEEKCKSIQHKDLTNQIKKIVKAQIEANKCNLTERDEKLMEFGNEMVMDSENSQRSQYFMSQTRKNDVFPVLDQTTGNEIPVIPFSTKRNKTSSPNSLPFQKITCGKTAEALFKSKLPHSNSFPNRRVEGAFGVGFNNTNTININENTSEYFRQPQNTSFKPKPRPTIVNEQQDLFKYLKQDTETHNETFVFQTHSNFPQFQPNQPLVERLPTASHYNHDTDSKDLPLDIKSSLNKMIASMFENSTSTTTLASTSKWGNNTSFRLSEPWERPIENELPISNLSGNEICLWKRDRPFKFTKEDLSKIQVIAQLDFKFIVSKIRAAGDNYMLVLFDQHAVHERIRLEDMIKEIRIDGKITSCEINPPIELNFTENQLNIILAYAKKFENVGIKFINYSNGLLKINGIPKTFLDKALNETNANQGIAIQKMVHALIEEVCDDLCQTRGVMTDTMPKTILNILQSVACHGAIKFGHPLSIKNCEELLYKLQFCQAPFQCAHGRPVLYPLIDLDENLKKFAYPEVKERRRIERNPSGSQSLSQSQQDYITSPFFNWNNPSIATSNNTEGPVENEDEKLSKYFPNSTNDDFNLF